MDDSVKTGNGCLDDGHQRSGGVAASTPASSALTKQEATLD